MSDNSQAPQYLPFYATPNLVEKRATICEPWNFNPGPEALAKVRALPKSNRRAWSSKPTTVWNCYSAVKGLAPSLRISHDNPPVALHGFVADYDVVSEMGEVTRHLGGMSPELRPTFLERSIGMKWRVVWCFERPLLCVSFEHATALLTAISKGLGAATLLAGFDEASHKPTEVWTNGGEWFDINPTPVPWTWLVGVAADVSKKSSLFGSVEIPIETIAEEVKKRFPDRWIGEFALDTQGVRFWDPAADCPTGCQVKPDGMLCFTGNTPFVRWSEIFGAHWCAEQRALNLGKAAESLYFTGREYWEPLGTRWVPVNRGDVILALKDRGLSDKTPKGATVSDVERVLRHIQIENRVDGAAPLINYAPGLVNIGGRRILNIARLEFPEYPADATGDPSQFPMIWEIMNQIFLVRSNCTVHPRDVFMAWLQRSIWCLRYHKALLGQTPFVCGPSNNGKSLLGYRIVVPLLGGKHSNPIDYFMGSTTFSDDLLESPVLMINDEAPAKNDSERVHFAHCIKSWVVNPTHTYHPKFMAKLDIPWIGRMFNTLNDDPLSVSLLPEVNENTKDKMMFFATQPFGRPWPTDVQARIEREIGYWGFHIDKVWQAPKEVLTDDRMGVISYFDEGLLEVSKTQLYSYNLIEFIKQWVKCCWGVDPEKANGSWTGTPTELFTEMGAHDILKSLMRDWSVPKMAKSLTVAARTPGSGIEFAGEGQRTFNIIKAKLNV